MILSLRLKGFRRYVDERFEMGPGVCFIDGRNNAGKTTLFLAIEYAFFGSAGGARTPTALMRPGANAMGVELVFTGRDKKTYRLQRMHQKPPRAKTKVVGAFTLKELVETRTGTTERYLLSSDFQDHEEVLARRLTEVTGLSRRVFDFAVHVRQGEIAAILDGDPRLDIALGITAAATANEEMRALALGDERLSEALPALEASLAHVDQERKGTEKDEGQLATTLATQRERILTQEAMLAGLGSDDGLGGFVKALEQAVERLNEEAQTVDELAAAQANLIARYGAPGVRQEQISALQAKLAADPSAKRADLEGRIARRAEVLQTDAATCEHCGSTIDVSAARRELAAWQKELTTIQSAGDPTLLRRELARLEEAQGEAARLESSLSRARSDLVMAETEARKLESPIDTAVQEPRARLKALQAVLDERRLRGAAVRAAAEATLSAATAAVSEIEERQATARTRRVDLEKEHARLAAAVEIRRQRRRRAGELRALAAAFKDLQEQLRTRATQELGEATLRIHRALAVDDELAALSIDPGRYQVLVTPRDTGIEMPATLAQGGGHRLLIGLAFRLALVERLGPFPFVLLDEPTYGLDERHRQTLLERITRVGLGDQILLITHQPMGEAKGQRIRIEKAAEVAP